MSRSSGVVFSFGGSIGVNILWASANARVFWCRRQPEWTSAFVLTPKENGASCRSGVSLCLKYLGVLFTSEGRVDWEVEKTYRLDTNLVKKRAQFWVQTAYMNLLSGEGFWTFLLDLLPPWPNPGKEEHNGSIGRCTDPKHASSPLERDILFLEFVKESGYFICRSLGLLWGNISTF